MTNIAFIPLSENSPEGSPGAQPSPGHSGKDYSKQRNAGKSYSASSKKSGKTSTPFSCQQAEKSARTKRSVGSILHGLPDTSDDSDSEFVNTPSLSSKSHILNAHRKYFQNENTSLATPASNGTTEKERSITKSQLAVIFLLVLMFQFSINVLLPPFQNYCRVLV